MNPDRLRLVPRFLVQVLVVTAAACAPIKSTPPLEPTPIVRHCLPGEMDVGPLGIPSLPHNGDSLIKVTGDSRYGVSIFDMTRRGETICVKEGTLDFGAVSNWTDPRA